MNTTKQMVTEHPGNFAVHGNLVSRAGRETPGRAQAANARRKHRRLAALIFGGIALVAYPLGRALAGLPRQEFEGLGMVACFFTYAGIFLWHVERALAQESLQAETPNEAGTEISDPNALQEKQAATQSELRRK